MEGDSQFINPGQMLEQFNQIQQSFGGTQQAINQGREIAGNMLLTMGVPFFAGRLEKHIGTDAVANLQKFASGELNVNDALNLAKTQFETKILPQAKKALFEEANKYVPGLEDIDLSNASVGDIKRIFQQKVTQKLKSALPDDIANALPENFSQDDIINSVRQLGTDRALAYAKQTLPPDVYSQLEANQDLISDPSKIAGFINENISQAKGNITRLANTTQQAVQQQLEGTRQELLSKVDETLKPLRDKVAQVSDLRQQGLDKFNQAKADLVSKYDDVQQKFNDFKNANPMATADDLAPFENQIRDFKISGRALKADFMTGDKDLASQLNDAKSVLTNNTSQLYSRIADLRQRAVGGLNDLAQQARDLPAQLTRAVAPTLAPVAEPEPAVAAPEPVVSAPEPVVSAPEPVVSAAPSMTPYVSPIEEEGVLTRFKSWTATKIKNVTQPISRNVQDIQQTAEGYRPRLLQADEPENAFSEQALTYRNPALAEYYGTELTPVKQLLNPDRPVLKAKVKKVKARQPAEEQPAPERPALGAQGQDIGFPMRQELMTRQSQLLQQAQETPAQPIATETPIQGLAQEPIPTQVQAPTPTTAPSEASQELAPEPLATPSTILEPEAEIAAPEIAQTAEKSTASVLSKVGATLEETAAATEEVPVLDILTDIGGLLGSIFGARALMGGESTRSPIVSGSSYEPNL
jgi:archaellum component FlaC